MHARPYLQNAAAILALYPRKQPFSAWLKQYFREHKKFGSTDRKMIGHLCYCYFRIGNAFPDRLPEDRIVTALFLCSEQPNTLLQELNQEWNECAAMDIPRKFEVLQQPEERTRIFPWNDALSKEIEVQAFNHSFLLQPRVYIRARPGREEKVRACLEDNGVVYEAINEHCIAVAPNTPVDRLLRLDAEAVIQDINSQKVFDLVHRPGVDQPSVWDCCAASGGKSILFHDLFSYRQLTVTDVRENILHNLQARLRRAGITRYRHFVADVSRPGFQLPEKFDFIICDAPCSGSGTWSRTPEQLSSFTSAQIDYYASLQKNISRNAAGCLRKNGMLLYITCSVFSEENEAIVEFLCRDLSLELKGSGYLKGYDHRADTLFAALFTL